MKKTAIIFLFIILAGLYAKSQTFTEIRNDVRITKGSYITTFKQDSLFKFFTNRSYFYFNRPITALNYLYLDSAKNSVKFGYLAGSADAGLRNVHIGHKAGETSNTSDVVNIGYRSGGSANISSVNIGAYAGFTGNGYLVNIGYKAGYNGSSKSRGVSIGYQAGFYNNADYNVFIGHNCASGQNYITGQGNYLIGADAFGKLTSGNYNIGIGYGTVNNLSTGTGNIIIGRGSADSLDTESNNIFIGNQSGIGINGSNNLCIGTNTLGNYPLIYGNFSSQYLNINGDLSIKDGKTFKIKDASGSDSLSILDNGTVCHFNSVNPVFFGVTTALFTPRYRFSVSSTSVMAVSTALVSPVVSFLNSSNSGNFTSIVLTTKTSSASHTTLINNHLGGNSSDFIISNCVNNSNARESFAIRANGEITLYADIPRKFKLDRSTTASSDGSNFEFYAGGATSGSTDKNSGNLILSSSTSTGTGFGYISLLTTTAGSTGTTDNASTEKVRITSGGDVLILANANGIILKDDAVTPHYWRVTITALGVLTTTDIGTTTPQ